MATKKTSQVAEVGDRIKTKDGRTAVVTQVYAEGDVKGEGPRYGVRYDPTDTVPGSVKGFANASDVEGVTKASAEEEAAKDAE